MYLGGALTSIHRSTWMISSIKSMQTEGNLFLGKVTAAENICQDFLRYFFIYPTFYCFFLYHSLHGRELFKKYFLPAPRNFSNLILPVSKPRLNSALVIGLIHVVGRWHWTSLLLWLPLTRKRKQSREHEMKIVCSTGFVATEGKKPDQDYFTGFIHFPKLGISALSHVRWLESNCWSWLYNPSKEQ